MSARLVKISSDVADLLNSEAKRINRPEFIDSDPVQFPRRFSKLQDIEISAFLSAIIAWGKRAMICRDAERLLNWMDNEPFAYVMDEGYEDFPDEQNIHRTFFGRHFKYFLRGLHAVYSRHSSLDEFGVSLKVGEDEYPAWKFVEELQKVMSEVNGGATCSQCLPVNLQQTALKRVNMALRWLVRDDGIVDMGVWKSIPKSKLFIPMDVHVSNTALDLGLTSRKAADRRNVVALTELLRQLNPGDPVVYDYALFGIGIGE